MHCKSIDCIHIPYVHTRRLYDMALSNAGNVYCHGDDVRNCCSHTTNLPLEIFKRGQCEQRC